MNNDKTDESLKRFLFTFKIHLDQFNEILQDLYQQITNGSKGIEELFKQTNEQMWNDIDKQQQQLLHDLSRIKSQDSLIDNKLFEKLVQLLNISE